MTAEWLDIGVITLLVLSAVIGLARGLVREALSLVSWVAAFALAVLYFKSLAAQLPFAGQSEVVRLGIAFAVIFLGVLILGAIINRLLSSAVASIGLGGVDHLLGGAFGVVRGGLIVVLLVLLFGLTDLSDQLWWKQSRLLPWFEGVASNVKSLVPKDLMGHDLSGYLNRPAEKPAP